MHASSRARASIRTLAVRPLARTGLAVLFALSSSGPAAGQSSASEEEEIYAAAADFLVSLHPVALVERTVCRHEWRRAYDVAIRCPARLPRADLTALGVRLEVPIEDASTCDRAVHPPGATELAFTPVQFRSDGRAWFLVLASCSGPAPRDSFHRIDRVDLRRLDGRWVVVETRPIAIT